MMWARWTPLKSVLCSYKIRLDKIEGSDKEKRGGEVGKGPIRKVGGEG